MKSWRQRLSASAAPTLSLVLTLFAYVPVRAEWARVEWVIDGDTFVTDEGEKIKMLDIDTPETNHPERGYEPGGAAATALAKSLLQGKRVWLEGEGADKYGRRLARVGLSDGRSYSDIVRQQGYDKRSGNQRGKYRNGKNNSLQSKGSGSAKRECAAHYRNGVNGH